MLKNNYKQLSLHSILYNKIPENHILKLINNAVNFNFINELLESSYCKYYGRPAKEPEMMAKILVLQYLYNLSDIRVMEELSVNLAYMWFIGVNPEEDLPDASLLAKFRTQRLQETTLDEIIKEIVKQCVQKGMIKGSGISIDCTHTKANTIKKVPERIMKHLAKKIFKELEKENGFIPKEIDCNIPNYKQIENHLIAKETMKTYLEKTILEIETKVNTDNCPKTKRIINKAQEILNDPKFILQKGIRSLVDEDARVGYKSKTDSFFGYKVEYMLTTDERIITGVRVHNGAYTDGTNFQELLNITEDCGIELDKVYGDKAYFRKPILDLIKQHKAKAYIPVSESVYRIDESKYTYNKDSDQWFCYLGNCTVEKKKIKRKDGSEFLKYKFDKETCRNCPNRKECIKGSTIANVLTIGINTPEFYEYNQFAKTDEFLEKYKKRACQEWKNGEMKRFHGLYRARGYGLESMSTQAKLTALAVNLKRIAKLVSSFTENIISFLRKFKLKTYHTKITF